ncbi:Frag1/DRAM/Sfk1 family protein [Aspergillus tanneri]|uniref:Protein sfk1 n=1 Tax=Aspergillus tanneri TaxID=1220188 RepID=A0A5M9MYR1_9EURO|nr:Protein sfk1 [Aspergillus tanneri]KAA8652252.1 Protein sfk1 [Aspergillus tanneri]
MLLAMLGHWVVVGSPIYASMEKGQTIAYISDVGAQSLKPLFIAGSVVTVVFLDLSFIAERWLRHAGQLVPNKGIFDKACAIGSIFFAVAGALGLILLSIFDTLRHSNLHSGFLVMFLVGYLISAILICAEYLRLGIFYRSQHRVLLASFVIKACFVVVEIALAIAFGVLPSRGHRNAAAVIEWGKEYSHVPCVAFPTNYGSVVIALIFTFYVLSFAIDLLPSVRTRRRVPQGEKRVTMAMNEPEVEVTHEEPLTMDSAGPIADDVNYYRGQRM